MVDGISKNDKRSVLMIPPDFRKQTFKSGGSAVETDNTIMGQEVISCFTKQKTGGGGAAF